MERFVTRHRDRIAGILSGFDRMIFRGTLRSMSYPGGLEAFLATRRVWLKDFGRFAQRVSERVKQHAQSVARTAGRPFEYLPSAATSKEDHARAILTQDGITDGLMCVLSCVEPCRTSDIHRDRAAKQIRPVVRERKCLHLSFYYVDREFGFMHVRVQTWLPLTIDVYVNGREWLARRLTRTGVAYTQVDNCFTAIADFPRAQRYSDELTTRDWPTLLTLWARRVMPWLDRRSGGDLHPYYWSQRQSEYATDVVFHRHAELTALYPRVTRHAIEAFHAPDVLRFLGRRFGHRSDGEVTTTFKRRREGVCVRHSVEENSLKMYDKAGCVLRIETTINKPTRFKLRRRTTHAGRRRTRWVPLRKGVIDLPRRVELSRAANARDLDALAVVGDPTVSAQVLDPVSRPAYLDGRRHRPLRPIAPDDATLEAALLAAAPHPSGFRHRDVLVHVGSRDTARTRGQVTRQLRLYRAHGLVQRIPGTHRYLVTAQGHLVMATAIHFRHSEVALMAA
jgi:hypothetical protein